MQSPGWEENRVRFIWGAFEKYKVLKPELQNELDELLMAVSQSPTVSTDEQTVRARGEGSEVSYGCQVGLWEIYYFLEPFEGNTVMFVADLYDLREEWPPRYRAWF